MAADPRIDPCKANAPLHCKLTAGQVAEQIQQAAALVEEARAAQQAALGKEARLAAEVEVLKAHLAGRAAEGDPLATLQHKVHLVGGVLPCSAGCLLGRVVT